MKLKSSMNLKTWFQPQNPLNLKKKDNWNGGGETSSSAFFSSNPEKIANHNQQSTKGLAHRYFRSRVWKSSGELIHQEKIQIRYYVTIYNGFQVYPWRPENHRAITRMLFEDSHEYHCFKLPEEKTLRIVFRGFRKSSPK